MLSYFLGIVLIVSGIAHLINPEMYAPLIPNFISESVANILAFIFEVAIGILLILPKYRHLGGLGFAILMLSFMPIHIWDYTKDTPFIGSKTRALIRIIVQVLLIYGGWYIYKLPKKKNLVRL